MMMKRLCDVFFSLLGLIVFSPLLLAIVLLTSSLPALTVVAPV